VYAKKDCSVEYGREIRMVAELLDSCTDYYDIQAPSQPLSEHPSKLFLSSLINPLKVNSKPPSKPPFKPPLGLSALTAINATNYF